MPDEQMKDTIHIHMTDIFHPHGDPDDHYDLALAFALHKAGRLHLARVLLDYPPAHRAGDPALCAVAQLNEICNLDIRASVEPRSTEESGKMICRLLRESEKRVTFSVVGSAVNIAAAVLQDPSLFREKCAGIYLAAGTGVETPGGELEYNARLNPLAYSAVLNAPCPLYWAPCYHTIRPGLDDRGGEWCSVFCFYQKEILPLLPPPVQKYFLYMLTRSADPKYLRYLENDVDQAALREFGEQKRRLWSAPLLLKAAGVPMNTVEFCPAAIDAKSDGHVRWAFQKDSEKNILHIRNFDCETDHTFDTTGSYKAEMLSKLMEFYCMLG